MWGHVEKIGKGTRASYDPDKKTLTFCFKRGPQTTGEELRKLREVLMKELKELGYDNYMKYNGEVLAEKIEEENVTLIKKNHQLTIKLRNKNEPKEKENNLSDESSEF